MNDISVDVLHAVLQFGIVNCAYYRDRLNSILIEHEDLEVEHQQLAARHEQLLIEKRAEKQQLNDRL